MNLQIEAAWEIHRFLTARNIPYAIIGELAVQYWGEPRFTKDVDVTVLVPAEDQEKVLCDLLSRFTPRISDALKFALKNRILLVCTASQCDIDISLGIPGYEEKVVAHVVDYELGNGRNIKFCSAEDLIIHKAVAGRPQDGSDIEGVILRQGKKLDILYIRRWLKEFSSLLEVSEIKQRFENPWKKFLRK